MPSQTSAFFKEASELIEAQLGALRTLSYAQAAALPATHGGEVRLAGQTGSITVFRQVLPQDQEGRLLVVVLAAIPLLAGLASSHLERGLVFHPNAEVRDATALELQDSGG